MQNIFIIMRHQDLHIHTTKIEKTRDYISHRPLCPLGLHSPSGCMFESGAQQEVSVEEEVAQVAFPLAQVHHEAVTHQLTSLG